MTARVFCGAALLTAFGLNSLFAQDQTQELQQLKDKVQQLATMMAAVQKEIAAIEQGQKAHAAAAPTAAPAASPASSTPGAVPFPPLPVTYIGTETRTRQTVSDFPAEAPRINNEELD